MLLRNLKRLYFKIKYTLFYLINRFVPCRFLIIKSKCPLRDDCKQEISSMVVTYKNDFKDTEILDFVFKSIRRHLKNEHNIKDFMGLEFKSSDLKYTVYLGDVGHR